MEHLTYEDIEEKFPEEYAAREVNKLTYRYPSGESYQVSGISESSISNSASAYFIWFCAFYAHICTEMMEIYDFELN